VISVLEILKVRRHFYHNVEAADFCYGLFLLIFLTQKFTFQVMRALKTHRRSLLLLLNKTKTGNLKN